MGRDGTDRSLGNSKKLSGPGNAAFLLASWADLRYSSGLSLLSESRVRRMSRVKLRTAWTYLLMCCVVQVLTSDLSLYAQNQLSSPDKMSASSGKTSSLIEPRSMTERVDELLSQQLRESGWQGAQQCSDAEFLRRASLDLIGVPPTAHEVVEFLRDSDAAKRGQLVDRLLASPSCAIHLAGTWAGWMLPENDGPAQQIGQQGLQFWLRNRFSENLRYDRLVADLLIATGPPQSGPTAFFVSLEGKPEKIAAKTARVFLGLQLDCAECHDHPFDKWTQKDFWGFAAYFAQLSTDADESMMRSGEVTDAREGEVLLPGTQQVIAPSPLVHTGESGLASGTRRQQLTLWLTARENPFVARAAVNRVWALLFGRGLIEPVDDMRNLEMASHPQLLQELSEYFAATNYDLRNLLSVLAKTDAYGRSGRHESGPPPVGSYAVMMAKPLTETQLSASLALVARQVAGEENASAQAALMSQLGRLRGDASEAKLGIVSALVTLHGDAFDRVSRDEKSRLLKALEAPYMDERQQLRWMFLATLSREPTPAEQQAFSESLPGADITESQESVDNATQWRSDLLWALINSTEFAMTP